MSIIDTLIFDRTQADVGRRNELFTKGWDNLTDEEKAEWLGDPYSVTDGSANLIPYNADFYGLGNTEVSFSGDDIRVTAAVESAPIYGFLIVGAAEKFAGKTVTLYLDGFTGTSANKNPRIQLYWYTPSTTGGTGSLKLAASGAYATAGKTVTYTLNGNDNSHTYFALRIYAAYSAKPALGDSVTYHGLMLTMGEHTELSYVPYRETVPTPATRGAYNSADLNRVENAVAYIAAYLLTVQDTVDVYLAENDVAPDARYDAGITVPDVAVKTDWTAEGIPTSADMERYLSNVRRVTDVLPITRTLPTSMAYLTYAGANGIERALYDEYGTAERTENSIMDEITRTAEAFYAVCGEEECGL